MLKKFKILPIKPNQIPIQPGLLRQPITKLLDVTNITLYQYIVGTLMYLMLITRPDIAFRV